MYILNNLGIEEKDIKNMTEQCPNILSLEENEITRKVEILKQIGCKEEHIRNILICNPYYLDRLETDILNLIRYLIKNKFECLYLLFDSNPFILNKDVFEIEKYINDKIANEEQLEDIIDELDSNPYLFDEM